jgi:signal transduction histidine kinase
VAASRVLSGDFLYQMGSELQQLQGRLADQLAALAAAPFEQIDDAIVEAQRELCRMLGMDRSAIWQSTPEAPEVLALTHLCTLDEIPPVPPGMNASQFFPWIVKQLFEGKIVAIPDTHALPTPEASVDRDSFLHYGDKSTLAIPFQQSGEPVRGCISFTATARHEQWSEQVLTQCRLITHVVHSVLRRKQSEREARDERMRLRTVLDSTERDVIWSVDAGNYSLLVWNRAYAEYFRKLTGREVHPGDTLEMLFGDDTVRIARWRSLYERARREGSVSVEYRLDVGDHVMQLELNRVMHQGVCEAISIFGRDITRQRSIEAQLLQAQKMEAVGRLAGGVAHDFNNLLTVICGVATLLGRKVEPTSPIAEGLGEILRTSERATALTKQLLAFSRQQPFRTSVINLAQVVRDTEQLLRRVLGETIALTIAIESPDARVLADSSQLDQVLLNLAVNARDAMPDGGTLVIEVSTIDIGGDESRARSSELPPGRYVQLAVRDTGHGIAPEHREKIFEPFFTTKQVGRGSGLGLPTVLGIAQQSGGGVWVESDIGRGTTVNVVLPITEASVLDEVPNTVDVPGGSGETILVVDDDPLVRKVTSTLLTSLGYDVLVANGGTEALALASSSERTIALVLTDIRMPGMSGPELARQLQKVRAGLGVVFASGFSDVRRQEIWMLSRVPVLEKPYSREALARAIHRALGA